MWKIIIFIMFCMGFASMSFAQDNATNEATLQNAKPQNVRQVYWLTIDNKASFGATMSYPYIKDPDVYYNIGLTFGGNITKYLGMQTSLSITPPMGVKDYTDILIDVMLIVQKDMGLANSGFRPYFGIGIGMENSFAFLHNISGVKTGIGLATEAGLRYYYKDFLVVYL